MVLETMVKTMIASLSLLLACASKKLALFCFSSMVSRNYTRSAMTACPCGLDTHSEHIQSEEHTAAYTRSVSSNISTISFL